MRRILLGLLVATTACTEPKGGDTSRPVPPSTLPQERPQRDPELAKSAAKELGQALQARLLEALARGGPATAIAACADDARSIADQIARKTGVNVGRSSLRLRNPNNGGPDWVTAWLEVQGERQAEGVQPTLSIVETKAGKLARFISPIPVGGLCLTCHGPDDVIDPAVKKLLSERYPRDQARRYEAGDLRGAIWAEAKL